MRETKLGISMVVQEGPTLSWNRSQASTRGIACAGDPDAYSLSYDSDDEEVQQTAEPEASFSGRQEVHLQQLQDCCLS